MSAERISKHFIIKFAKSASQETAACRVPESHAEIKTVLQLATNLVERPSLDEPRSYAVFDPEETTCVPATENVRKRATEIRITFRWAASL
jgi:hypothetical protein